tara:strand:+ start:2504 stop:2773 length:270 start_codon:yes stop_codon:yes gene_type:complete
MKKIELKNLIKSLLVEQMMPGRGEQKQNQSVTIPLEGFSEADIAELEQEFMREFPGGVIEMGGARRRRRPFRIRIKFGWPPSITIIIEF